MRTIIAMSTQPEGIVSLFSAERAKAFIDAVVAIAMTLLILPLMESVSDAAGADATAWDWFAEHSDQLLSFALSFVIIAMFWINHHRLFGHVERVSGPLLWLTMAWLLSIVWLPVATAMSGQFSAGDPGVRAVYIGSMLVTSLLLVAIRSYLRRHPAMLDTEPTTLNRGMAVELAMVTLFAAALVTSLLVPALTYFPLFLLALTGPLGALYARAGDRSAS
jgi:uncharacterized membrane protein